MAEVIVHRVEARHWWLFILRGILFLIAGFLTFRYPLESYITLSIFFGVTMFVTGIIELYYVFSNRRTQGWGWRFAAALIDFILGIVLILNINITMAVLPFLVSIWFLFRGIAMMSFTGVLKDTGSIAWLVTGGILLILLAVLILFDPAFGAITIITWTGIAFIVAGIFNIVLAFKLKAGSTGLAHRSDPLVPS